jgi:hypothetical protein
MFAGLLAAAVASSSYTLTAGAADLSVPFVDISGGGRPTTKRGKHKLPRHGQKLKSCRNKISRRVRRKHRRAA